MATTPGLIKEWFQEGVKKKATHMLVVCDTFDYDDYPVFVSKKEKVKKVFEHYNGPNMQRVMEVYNLKKSMEKQLAQERATNF